MTHVHLVTIWNYLLTFSLKLKVERFSTLSLFLRFTNWVLETALVNTSATWSMEGTCWIETFLCKTFSLTKYKSNSMCFFLECNTGLEANITVLRLSHQITGGVGKVILISERIDCSQVISATKLARLLYSTFVLNLDIVCCFFNCQVTKFEPKYTQNPEVDLRSLGSEAQSASQNTTRSRVWDFLKCNPWWRVSFKYLRILLTTFQWDSNGAYIYWQTLLTL